MAEKIDMEYTIGNHVEFIRTDNDAVIVKLDTALAFERQQVQDVAKLAEYYRALTQVAREERDAAIAKLAEYEGDNKRWHSFETVQAIVKQRDAAIADARKLAQNWNGVMTSVEIEAIVKKYLNSKRA